MPLALFRRHIRGHGSVLIIFICFCVAMQILGVSVSMWNPWEESDESKSFDFSIPPIIPSLKLSILSTMSETSLFALHLPPIPHTVFQPPEFGAHNLPG